MKVSRQNCTTVFYLFTASNFSNRGGGCVTNMRFVRICMYSWLQATPGHVPLLYRDLDCNLDTDTQRLGQSPHHSIAVECTLEYYPTETELKSTCDRLDRQCPMNDSRPFHTFSYYDSWERPWPDIHVCKRTVGQKSERASDDARGR